MAELTVTEREFSVFEAVQGVSRDIFSSFNETKSIVLHQSYFFASDVVSIGITQTGHGITNKQVLCMCFFI